eukprot:GFKZ01001038.1.p2 GENE.GFKZ01001038.1~~GFKZ01001038.1.p2  ORF type:complete len:203 (+),score=48.69 GFKZ01001038.1:138-746(+)
MIKPVLLFEAILAIVLLFAVLNTLTAAAEEDASTVDPASAEQPTELSTDETAFVENPSPEQIPDDATLRKMKVRELKAILAKKGPNAECLACTSKQEYIDRIHETSDWPDAPPEDMDADDEDPPSPEELAAMFNKGRDSEEMARLRKNLEEAGIDPSNLFSTGDNFDADAFAKKFASWEEKRGASAGADDSPSSADDLKTEL